MKARRIFLAVLVCLAVSSSSHAHDVGLESGYPKSGNGAGSIDLQGIYTPDCGWSLVDDTLEFWLWQDGLVLTTKRLKVSGGRFRQTVTGLESGKSYNVLVKMTLTNGRETITILSDPATAKTK